MVVILDFKMADSLDQCFMTSIELLVPENIGLGTKINLLWLVMAELFVSLKFWRPYWISMWLTHRIIL